MFVVHDILSFESNIGISFSGTLTVYVSLTGSDYPHHIIFCLFHSYCVICNI